MEIDSLHKMMGETLIKIWNVNDQDKLSVACLYTLNLLNRDDLIYWETGLILHEILEVRKGNNIPRHQIDLVMIAIYCLLASNQTIYHLPSMLNQRFIYGKIATHLVFGESLANLAAISLVAESYKLLLHVNSNINNSNLLKVVNSEISEFRHTSQLVKKFGQPNQALLADDFKQFRSVLLANTIKCILVIYGDSYENVVSQNEKIRQIVDRLMASRYSQDKIRSITEELF